MDTTHKRETDKLDLTKINFCCVDAPVGANICKLHIQQRASFQNIWRTLKSQPNETIWLENGQDTQTGVAPRGNADGRRAREKMWTSLGIREIQIKAKEISLLTYQNGWNERLWRPQRLTMAGKTGVLPHFWCGCKMAGKSPTTSLFMDSLTSNPRETQTVWFRDAVSVKWLYFDGRTDRCLPGLGTWGGWCIHEGVWCGFRRVTGDPCGHGVLSIVPMVLGTQVPQALHRYTARCTHTRVHTETDI